jgi:multidrug efflux pump subunit AcrA (membrane-fusion protein)
MSPETAPAPRRVTRRGLALAGIIGAIVVVLVVVNGIWSRNSSEARLKEVTLAQSTPTVSVVLPTRGANKSSLDLPGRLEAFARAPIYARVSGILKAWYVDIGAPVKADSICWSRSGASISASSCPAFTGAPMSTYQAFRMPLTRA